MFLLQSPQCTDVVGNHSAWLHYTAMWMSFVRWWRPFFIFRTKHISFYFMQINPLCFDCFLKHKKKYIIQFCITHLWQVLGQKRFLKFERRTGTTGTCGVTCSFDLNEFLCYCICMFHNLFSVKCGHKRATCLLNMIFLVMLLWVGHKPMTG